MSRSGQQLAAADSWRCVRLSCLRRLRADGMNFSSIAANSNYPPWFCSKWPPSSTNTGTTDGVANSHWCEQRADSHHNLPPLSALTLFALQPCSVRACPEWRAFRQWPMTTGSTSETQTFEANGTMSTKRTLGTTNWPQSVRRCRTNQPSSACSRRCNVNVKDFLLIRVKALCVKALFNRTKLNYSRQTPQLSKKHVVNRITI